jgi:predicted peptidase
MFVSNNFTTEGKTLSYNLYIPKNCFRGLKYPLVLFMHDAGSCSDDVCAALAQGNGAVVWARDAAMGKRPCYVVAPQYSEVCANDSFEVTWHAEATISLIKSLVERFPIDTARIYGTGQSMGCMMLCEMMLRHPNFFAGSLLVAGQWDPNRMSAVRDSAIWAVVAAGDEKAFPIMGACFDSMENAGGKVSRCYLDARADMAVLEESVNRQKALGSNLNFTWFSGKSILPANAPDHSGMHHVSTWGKAYDIEALREWLFEQRISGCKRTSDGRCG